MSNADGAIKRLFAIYGNPKTEDPDAFVDEYRRALGGYTPETLNKCIDVVVQDFRPFANQPWPAISDMVKAAKKVCEGVTDGKGEMDKIREKVRSANKAAKQRAAWWLERSLLGQQALKEGWPRELWEWVTQVYSEDLQEDRRIDYEKIRFDPERIAYARENCQSGQMILTDLMVIFGTREKALEKYKAIYGEEWSQPDPAPVVPPRGGTLNWKRSTYGPFMAMQRGSPNRELHIDITKRITGERE